MVTADVGASPHTYQLTCDPAGGDHPQPAEACAILQKVGVKVFDPIAKDTVCSQVYGGPQTATVKGSVDGNAIDAIFTRRNGCEIARWEKLGTTFFNVPMQ